LHPLSISVNSEATVNSGLSRHASIGSESDSALPFPSSTIASALPAATKLPRLITPAQQQQLDELKITVDEKDEMDRLYGTGTKTALSRKQKHLLVALCVFKLSGDVQQYSKMLKPELLELINTSVRHSCDCLNCCTYSIPH
jgi:hypothetical protein